MEDKQQNDHTQLVQTKRRLDDSEQPSCSNKRSKSDTYDDIKERLKKSYETDFSSVCVTPLYSEDDRLDMLAIYTRPKMEHVQYHKSKQSKGNFKISSYEQVFCSPYELLFRKANTEFRNVFITGDAGMGKTTFGQFMSLIWSKNIADIGSDEDFQNDAKFMTNFEFVFYILLNETDREDVVSMIIDKYCNTSSKDEFEEKIKTIEQILQTKNSLVILDGLDEWRPDIRGHRKLTLPRKVTSDRCTFLTTCRPYRIETVRRSEMDVDHQVKITGFDAKQYVREVIVYINRSQNTNKQADDFFEQIRDCGMNEQLQIPLIASQLIVVWFKYEMENMSKAMIYGSIVEMLFDRAIENEIKFPSMASAEVHFPESFSKFTYLRQYGCVLEEVCLLSYQLLFNPNFKTPSLVFTKKQLMTEPFNISPGKLDFLCRLGIISKNKVIGNFGDQELMLSFLHMSYLEFLAALFVTLFDKNGLFPEAVKKIAIDDMDGFRNFLILLSGISPKMTNIFFDTFYLERKDELDLLRRKLVTPDFESSTLDEMQLHILEYFIEMFVSVSDNSQKYIRLEDFDFTIEFNDLCDYLEIYQYDDDRLCRETKALLVMNKSCVKSLITDRYLNVFAEIKGLQFLIIRSGDYPYDFFRDDPKLDTCEYDGFNDVLLQNKLTLHSIRMESIFLSSQLPLRSLSYLTTICFHDVFTKHDVLQDLLNSISSNFLLENIYLTSVLCQEHRLRTCEHQRYRYGKMCHLTLNLSDHSKLLTVTLKDIKVICTGINTSCLKSLSIDRHTLSYSYVEVPILIDSENSIKNSNLNHLRIAGNSICYSHVNDVIKAIESLRYLEDLTLESFTIPDSVSLQLHPDIVCDKHINVKLKKVTMSDKCFHEFIDGIINCQSMVRVRMKKCKVRCDDFSHPYFEYGFNSMEGVEYCIENIPGLIMKKKHCYDDFEFETMK